MQTDTHRLSVSLQYAQGSTADQIISTTDNTNVGPCEVTIQMLKPTADQKTRIAVNIIVSRTGHLSCVKYKQDRRQYCNQIHHFDSCKQTK